MPINEQDVIVVSTDFIEKNNGRNDDHIFDVKYLVLLAEQSTVRCYKSYVLNRINQDYSLSDSWKG
jgi:hypothetical protein